MKNSSLLQHTAQLGIVAVLSACLFQTGCKPSESTSEGTSSSGGSGTPAASGKVNIQNLGSDTMVNLAQAWAEAYAKVDPGVAIEVSGGGSGTGIAALINGTVDIANCSRAMKAAEVTKAKNSTGKVPKESITGFDALAVYVHKDNPLNEITLEQLGQIYGEGGTITKWSQLGIQNAPCSSDEIVRVSRQSNSGTYAFFREAILGKGDFKLGSKDLHGSKDVVELVATTPCAIGYSGMGYATEHVKMLKIATKKGEAYYEPNVANTLAKTYPIARPLYMYTLGEPTGKVKEYMDWIHGPEGQKIVGDSGYVPMPK